MKNRAEWLTFGVFVIAVLGALAFLLRRGVHGQSAALAVALVVILLLRIGIFAWNLRRERRVARWPIVRTGVDKVRSGNVVLHSVPANEAGRSCAGKSGSEFYLLLEFAGPWPSATRFLARTDCNWRYRG